MGKKNSPSWLFRVLVTVTAGVVAPVCVLAYANDTLYQTEYSETVNQNYSWFTTTGETYHYFRDNFTYSTSSDVAICGVRASLTKQLTDPGTHYGWITASAGTSTWSSTAFEIEGLYATEVTSSPPLTEMEFMPCIYLPAEDEITFAWESDYTWFESTGWNGYTQNWNDEAEPDNGLGPITQQASYDGITWEDMPGEYDVISVDTIFGSTSSDYCVENYCENTTGTVELTWCQESESNWFIYGLKYLFCPPPGLALNVSVAIDEMNTKVPFGYFEQVQLALGGLEVTSIEEVSDLDIPVETVAMGTTTIVKVIDMDALSEITGLEAVRTIIIQFFRIAIGFLVFQFIWDEVTGGKHLAE